MPKQYIKIRGANEHNLKNIDVKFPLGVMTCVTGVSGSGKSSLVNEILYKSMAKKLNRARVIPGKHKRIEGLEMLDKVTCDIGEIPTMLNLEQQAYFALGYRQMTAELNRRLNELRKLKKEQKAAAETDEEE